MTHSYPDKQTSKNKQVKNKQIKCEALGSLQYGCKSSFRLLAQAESTIEAKRFFLVTVNPPMLNSITFPLRTYAKSLHEGNITLLAETKVVFKTHPSHSLFGFGVSAHSRSSHRLSQFNATNLCRSGQVRAKGLACILHMRANITTTQWQSCNMDSFFFIVLVTVFSRFVPMDLSHPDD